MKGLLILASVAAAAPGLALAAMGGEVCRRGEDVRTIRVVSPGSVGAACDVEVQRADGSIAIPYHANADGNHCRAMAAELAATLTVDGFSCSTALLEAVDDSLAGGEPAAPAAAATLATAAPALAASTAMAPNPVAPPAPTVVSSGFSEVDMAEKPAFAPSTLIQPPTAPAAQAESPASAAAAPVSALAPEEASFGAPVNLTAAARPIAVKAPAPPRATGARRLVGAQPADEDSLDPLVLAEAGAPAPAIEAPAAPSAATPAAPAAGVAPPPVARPIDDLIRNVIAANVAAWNEGNLEAFMAGYVKDANTTLTVDGDVVKGFSSLRKYFAKEAADAGAMGRLALSDLDVSRTSDDVVTVVGRYVVERASGGTKGSTTIVMKRTDGHWRISHETRTRERALKD